MPAYQVERRERAGFVTKIEHLNQLLADEFIGYRLRPNGHETYDTHRIDSPLLHREIVDRTFEVTAAPEFASVANDYADGWRAYSKGQMDDAIFKVGKAVESAKKVLIRKLNPTVDENVTAARLAQLVFDLGVLPSRLQTFDAQLRTLYSQTTGPVRNQPGIGHGSADLVSPEAALALLMLNLGGSLIVFLVQAYERRTPSAAPPPPPSP